jgi:hypothetical protein
VELADSDLHVFKLSFQVGESLAVRVPLYMDAGSPDAKIEALQTERRNLSALRVDVAQRARGSSGMRTLHRASEGQGAQSDGLDTAVLDRVHTGKWCV